MATIEDMAEVVNNVYHNSGEITSRILKLSSRRFSSIIMDLMYQALRDAENDGKSYNDFYIPPILNRSLWESCTCWRVGDYIITYLTDDEGFEVDMLTDEMMYDLIIERA